MSNFYNWFKDKTLLKIIVSLVLTVVIAFLMAYFIPYGWIATIIFTVCVAHLYIKPLIFKKLNELATELKEEFDQLEKEDKLPKHNH